MTQGHASCSTDEESDGRPQCDHGDDIDDFLDTLEGELSFFRAVMHIRPVGLHRHFHVLSIRNAIYKETSTLVTVDSIWRKLQSCYELEALEALELDGYDSPSSTDTTPVSARPLSPSDNLAAHPHFRSEYTIPVEEFYSALIAKRRTRDTPSASPAPVPPRRGRPKKKGKATAAMAGLVGGDSDSSALTLESGDEGLGGAEPELTETPGESAAAETDGGTEDAEAEPDEDEEAADASPEPSPTTSRSTRGRKPMRKTTGPMTRTRASTRPVKKRKR